MEEKVKAKIKSDEIFSLIREQWSRADYVTFNDLHFDDEHPHIVVVNTNVDSAITIDIITGAFLVDGLPLSRLPNAIMANATYRWFFGNVVFEVQPDAQGCFSSAQKYNECNYEFKVIRGMVIVTERKVNVFEKELIDRQVFKNDFPYFLVKNYSHWWNKGEKCVEFRRRTFGKEHFSKQIDVEYRFDLVKHQLIHTQSKHLMLDIKSKSYKKIVKQVARLEHAKYIHVFLVNEKMARVELTRMNLKFTIECASVAHRHNHLMSNEFNGMRVSEKQKIGTLLGLRHGLILESITDDKNLRKQILLIPNGNFQINQLRIDTKDELQNPPFFLYNVDKFCRQLKSTNASHASWFKLALLHAITSHGEIEPFTGMSGTERAIQILQSAFAWSSAPYEPAAYEILREIAYLTPIRKMHKHVQQVIWPKNIPARLAQDCFVFIVKKLIEDSQRLSKFHGKKLDKKFDLKTVYKLNKRDHQRCEQLNPNLCISDTFIKSKVLETSLPTIEQKPFSDLTRTVCNLYHMGRFQVPGNFNLQPFLTKLGTVKGLRNTNWIKNVLNHSVQEDLRDLWITLYDAALKQTLNREQFAVILSFYAHAGVEIKPILALQVIATQPRQFQHIKPPTNETFHKFPETYRRERICELLKCNYEQQVQQNYETWTLSGGKRQEILLQTIIDNTTATISNNWPCNTFRFLDNWSFKFLDFDKATDDINKQLKSWYANHMLNIFIGRVERELRLLSASGVVDTVSSLNSMAFAVPTAKNWPRFSIDIDGKLRENLNNFRPQIDEAKNVWQLKNESDRTAQEWWEIYEKLSNTEHTQHLIHAGLFLRLVPSLLLPKLTSTTFDGDLKCLIGAYAMATAREQRANRIQAYAQQRLTAALGREEENIPYVNWSPCNYPEWLLFEIEQNLTIRRIQIEIAKRMIQPPENGAQHAVMQLNMGEGKTAVIVPILAAKLANRTQVCQIMVLKSLFATNLKELCQYLGGFLNRRIYTFPCRRDLPIETNIDDILRIHEECQQKKGVILTIPEYRLSFQLKIYELISIEQRKDEHRNYKTAKRLLDVLKWTNANVRTILDESDAILTPKYQLVYTVGSQMAPDGDSQRWLVTQAVLKRVPHHMKKLYEIYGKEKIEYGHTYGDNNYDQIRFTPCRILDETVFEALKELLIADFLVGRLEINFPPIDESKRPSIAKLLKYKAITPAEFRAIEHFSAEKQNIILILSGLLRFEVLKMALTKRWRVNYGVDVKSTRKMAIPFKAKDVAAENTEFGHPDVAVCLTQMSYYYSGLTDAQIRQMFTILDNTPDAENIYAKWIDDIPKEQLDPTVCSYNGINLDDPVQRDRYLFPLLRFNMNAIDFWLSNIAFPQDLKVFEKKLMCTAWDLCSDHFQHQVTGFSGTNDTQNILPISIAQNDLTELEDTNTRMRDILLQSRNSVYPHPSNVSGKEILKELVVRKIPVLCDSGALMLELNNKEVAIEWLKLAINCDAAVYFDECDTLQTIDRNGIVTEYQNSVYREDLMKCVVYLDDAHTRGTDLKFPPNCRACVTLSGDITRDKTVQSCMRMRQLATTQSIMFWASYEADIRLRELSRQGEVKSQHVMQFIEMNSQRFEKENMTHWTTAALNYTKKLVGHKLHELSATTGDESCLDQLYEACVDDDFVKLRTVFGEKEEILLTQIAWDTFSKMTFKCKDKQIRPFIETMKRNVDDKLENQAADVKRFTHALDEEQEKQLELEVDEQRQVERPPEAQPAKPCIDKRLEKLVVNGMADDIVADMKQSTTLLSMVASLSNTRIFEFCENNYDAWAGHIFVTNDFKTVLDSKSQACDDFLRPVSWIASIRNTNPDEKDILILLSSFECNHLLPLFRKSTNATLFMYHPRLSNVHSNLIHEAGLQVTRMDTKMSINVEDEIQIGVYAGLMYFGNETEQNAYCGFLGLIPRPWTHEQEIAFEEGTIEENGFVAIRKRSSSQAIASCVGRSKFSSNPTDLAIKLIKFHHQVLPKDCHVASILNRGIKAFAVDYTMELHL